MLEIPTAERELLAFTNDMIEACSVSQAMRASYYRLLNVISETGRYDGTKALVNMMNTHLERTASHLFSPVELKFSIDFDNEYDVNQVKRAEVVAKHLTRQWQRSSTDILFGRGVYEGLKYGSSILKQWTSSEDGQTPCYEKKLVLPWNFGVFREDENEIDKQECLMETSALTGPEVWQRIYRFPDAKKLFDKIMIHARAGETTTAPDSFFHQVLSTSQLQTGVGANTRPLPGGIVQLGNDPNYAVMGPTVGVPTVKFRELWVKGEEDYQVIQMVEPDVLITRFKLSNLLIKGSKRQPYRLIQPNPTSNWFWGRSELVDLIEPQGLLAQWLDDLKRLIGLQIDKIISFTGENQITDEVYAQFRTSGYVNLGVGGSATDLTPKFPSELLPVIKELIGWINMLGSFPEIMQGKGESGVRAGVHADTLLKTASPTLRDRALLVERQAAIAADLTLELMEAKEDRNFWTVADTPQTIEQSSFMISDLPQDWHVTVDSHSSSPIFANESQQLIFALLKAGIVGGDYAIDNLPLPNKEAAKAGLKQRAKVKQEEFKTLMEKFPEDAGKAMAKSLIGGGRSR